MAAVNVTRSATHDAAHFWTAFFSLLSAILTALGLKRTPSAAVPVYAADAAAATTAASATTAAPASTVEAAPARGAVPEPSRFVPAWVPGFHVRSLPPTIKQRIRAEAHGTSPSVRHLPTQAGRSPRTAQPAQSVRPTQPAADTRKDLADVTDQVQHTDLALAA
ncbi:DUF6344 domain-containing protein [Streptomyces sp. WAC05374]|uniref:DUF6344 domain-containing protein n=1 Tax=Streptomyces sp. WAC05374 TaxID=2487420 RepID=UPI00163C20B6|nr:DUF6344 domain-containing protein [Streptomyces sp. WAC05374]